MHVKDSVEKKKLLLGIPNITEVKTVKLAIRDKGQNRLVEPDKYNPPYKIWWMKPDKI